MGATRAKQPLVIDVTNPHIPNIDDPRIKETAEKLPKANPPIIKKIDDELTEDDIKNIIDLYNNGEHVRTISNSLLIGLETVRTVVRKKTNCSTMIHPQYNKNSVTNTKKRNPHLTDHDILPTEKGKKKRTQKVTAEQDLINNFIAFTQNSNEPIDESLINKLVGKSQILTRTEIINILADHGYINAEDYLEPEVIKRPEPKIDFSEFKKIVKVGDKYKIRSSRGDRRIVVTVEKVYPNIVITDKGCYQIAELYCGKKVDSDTPPDPQEEEEFLFSFLNGED